MLRAAPPLALLLFLGPIAAGLLGTLLPALGYLPALAGEQLSLQPWRDLLAEPGLASSVTLSLTIGLVATAVSLVIGVAWGSVAGFVGGRTDEAMMRIVDVLYSLPFIFFVILLMVAFGSNLVLMFLAIGAVEWLTMSRIVRGQFLALREQEFVQATKALGYGPARIIFRHILPNSMAPIIVVATLGIGNTILTEAALSFLGLGVQPPTASWGSMVSDGKDALINAWWIATFPGLAIVLTVVCFNLLGDAARDALDPRLRS